mmetsp:Transcript_103838/g.190179  ORF Transcript_103838/g.190179 Transcript_103838/m.190179 type:complete len:688 (+) Transcript_103838:40-2103(+)
MERRSLSCPGNATDLQSRSHCNSLQPLHSRRSRASSHSRGLVPCMQKPKLCKSQTELCQENTTTVPAVDETEVLRDLWLAQCDASRRFLDADKFLRVQSALSEELGVKWSKEDGMRHFLVLSANIFQTKMGFPVFAAWQRQHLTSMGAWSGSTRIQEQEIVKEIAKSLQHTATTKARSPKARSPKTIDKQARSPKGDEEDEGATKIQSIQRGKKARAEVRRKKEDKAEVEGTVKKPQAEQALKKHRNLEKEHTRIGQTARGPEDLLLSRGLQLKSGTIKDLAARGRDTPESHAQSISKLASYLIQPAKSDEQKAWVIFSWVCHHVSYDCEGYRNKGKRKSCRPSDVLKSRQSVCQGYADIYTALAKEAGLEVQTVTGHARNSTREIGQDIIRDGVGGHAWNAVKVDGQWLLLDSCWGAGTCGGEFHREFRPHFFGVHPEVLLFSHFPTDTKWQLLPTPLSYREFISQPIVHTDGMTSNGLKFVPEFRPPGAIMLKSSNQDSIQLQVPLHTELLVNIDDDDRRCFQERQENGLVKIHFRVPKGPSENKLKIYAKRRDLRGSYGAVCTLNVVGPVRPARFVEPYFPHVWRDVCTAHNVHFPEKLPKGLLVASGKPCEASIEFSVPSEMSITTQPRHGDGVRVQRDGDSCTVTATSCPPKGEQLNIFVGRGGAGTLQCAMSLMIRAAAKK